MFEDEGSSPPLDTEVLNEALQHCNTQETLTKAAAQEPTTIENAESCNDDSNDLRQNLRVLTTPTSCKVHKESVQYVDERTKAIGRKAELDELRKKKELTKKKGESVVPCHVGPSQL